MTIKIIRNIVFVLWITIYPCYAANVVFFDESPESSVAGCQLKRVSQFYGLKVECLAVNADKNIRQFADTLQRNDVQAVVITGRALKYINLLDFLSIFQLEAAKNIPLLILNVTSHTVPKILSNISKGNIMECRNFSGVLHNGLYKVAGLEKIARELSGQTFTFSHKNFDYFVLNKNNNVQSIIQVGNGIVETLFPVFVKTVVDGREIFFQTELQPLNPDEELTSRYGSCHFLGKAPLMMFLRYSCREKCWHSTKNYANLTIDDPWLTEPYGYLSYKKLLKEMEERNFHTTIAFVPWNFDRSKPEVVSMFREHPNKFSICIHGNNHDHREFYKYTAESDDPWPAKPLDVHEENIKQALARMEKFKQMTGLTYDRVMVFPHAIAPAKTLGLLKKYNFLATVNLGNVPLGSKHPANILFQLRSGTLKFENFLSLKRYTPSRSQSAIAIDLFLDNPILLFIHSDFFGNSIEAFNKTANIINNIKPDIIWQSLGNIVQHLYLEKLRDDGQYDLLTFSNNFIIENTHKRNVTFFVQKEESFVPQIKQVTIDGQVCFYRKSEDNLMFDVSIPPEESRHIIIEYKNDLNLELIDTQKNNLRVNLLRRLSDFRDMTFSTNMIGRNLTHFYYKTGLYKVGLMRLTILFFILALFIISGSWYFRKHGKKI